jgi:Protein of unknown function (DUF3455)
MHFVAYNGEDPVRTISAFFFVAALAAARQAAVPESLRPPAGEDLTFQAHGVGVQIYSCTSKEGQFTWVLQGPDAKLLDSGGKQIGKHYTGPTWQAADGSSVMAKPLATSPSPDAGSVPWLLLKTTKNEGTGVLSTVLSIQRLNTKGGKAPATGCDASHAGQNVRVSYEADYYFYSGSVHH